MKQINDLVIGAQYYRAPLPEAKEWERDIENIRKIGMNTVKLFPQWRWHERIKGQFYWGDMDKLFDICEKNKLYIYVNVVLDAAPDWLFREGHGIRVTNKGVVMQPTANGCRYIGGWEPCFDDPVVRKESEPFLRAIIERYKNREFLIVWDIWNEPRSRWGECACEESKKSYREWLKREYNSIEELNKFWGKAWTSFDDIIPPALIRDYADMYLWRHWAMYSVADRVSWAYKIAKSLDKKHPVMAHVGASSVIQRISEDTSNDWLVSRGVDCYGSSMGIDNEEPSYLRRPSPGYCCDWIKNISKEDFWIAEFYPEISGWKQNVTPEELRLRLWSIFAHGTKNILFWQYRAERVGNESNGHGLVELNGEFNDRTIEAAKIFKIVDKNREIFKSYEAQPAEVALIYDHKSHLISSIECAGYERFGFSGTIPTEGSCYKESLRGSYALFWENNIPVDIISVNDIKEIHSYKLVYLSIPYIVDKNTTNELVKFVKNGGILISEASIGLREENTWVSTANPNEKLRDVFGAEEKSREAVSKPVNINIPSFKMKIPVTRMITQIGKKGDAITINQYGKGKAILLGFYTGASYFDTGDSRLVRFMSRLLENMDIHSPVKLKGSTKGIQARVLIKDDNVLLILFNYENKGKQVEFTIPNISEFTGLHNASKLEKTKSGVRISLPAREVSLILCERGER